MSYVVIVNGRQFEIGLPKLVGSQVRALAAVPRDHALIVEGAGTGDEDRLLNDDDAVTVDHGPVHIYSKPPTAFGQTRRLDSSR